MKNIHEIIKIFPVKTEHELQSVRKIRNQCKHFMTRYNEDITEKQQSEWFEKLDHDMNWLFIFNKIYHGVIVDSIGYGFNRIENNSILLTGGLIESERGKGYGRALFSFLLEHAKAFKLPIKLEVLKNNIPAKKLYESLGFISINENESSIKMEYKNDSTI